MKIDAPCSAVTRVQVNLKCCHSVTQVCIQSIKKLEMNRHSSSVSLTTDDVMGNHVVRGARDLSGARKPPLLKRATFGDEEILRRAGWLPTDIKRDAIRPFSVCSYLFIYSTVSCSEVRKCTKVCEHEQ